MEKCGQKERIRIEKMNRISDILFQTVKKGKESFEEFALALFIFNDIKKEMEKIGQKREEGE